MTKTCKQTAFLLLTADGLVPLKKGNTLFNAGFVSPNSAKIDLGFLPFDRKFRKFRMEGKWKVRGAFHLVKISGISGLAVNGTRFVGSSHWKIPRKSGKSKKVVPFSRLEFPNGMPCSIYLSRSLYQFQVHGRASRRTGVYDQMEQLFTNRKFHFCSHRNFPVFFLNGKRPRSLFGNSNRN